MVRFVNVACGNSSFVLTFSPPFPLRIFFARVVFMEENVAIACTNYEMNTTSMTWGKGVVSLLNVLLLRRTKIYWGGKQRVGYHRVLELLQVLTRKNFSAKTFTLRMTWTSCSTKWIFQRGARNLFIDTTCSVSIRGRNSFHRCFHLYIFCSNNTSVNLAILVWFCRPFTLVSCVFFNSLLVR